MLTQADFSSSSSGNFDLTGNANGDQVFIYLGTQTEPTVFLCGFNQNPDWDWDPGIEMGTGAATSHRPSRPWTAVRLVMTPLLVGLIAMATIVKHIE